MLKPQPESSNIKNSDSDRYTTSTKGLAEPARNIMARSKEPACHSAWTRPQ